MTGESWRQRVLAAVFAAEVSGARPTLVELSLRAGGDRELVRKELVKAQKEGEVTNANRLTEKGRKELTVVFIGGGFEVIHEGHLHTIQRAKRLGDVLVVSVARDSTIRKRKKREPVSSEDARVRMLSALRDVDSAILGVEGDIYETLERVRPDIVALGYDQHHSEEDILREAKKRGIKLKVVRLDSPIPGTKTSKLLSEF